MSERNDEQGTDVWRGRKKIETNEKGLAKWGNLTHKSRLKLLMFNNR